MLLFVVYPNATRWIEEELKAKKLSPKLESHEPAGLGVFKGDGEEPVSSPSIKHLKIYC